MLNKNSFLSSNNIPSEFSIVIGSYVDEDWGEAYFGYGLQSEADKQISPGIPYYLTSEGKSILSSLCDDHSHIEAGYENAYVKFTQKLDKNIEVILNGKLSLTIPKGDSSISAPKYTTWGFLEKVGQRVKFKLSPPPQVTSTQKLWNQSKEDSQFSKEGCVNVWKEGESFKVRSFLTNCREQAQLFSILVYSRTLDMCSGKIRRYCSVSGWNRDFCKFFRLGWGITRTSHNGQLFKCQSYRFKRLQNIEFRPFLYKSLRNLGLSSLSLIENPTQRVLA